MSDTRKEDKIEDLLKLQDRLEDEVMMRNGLRKLTEYPEFIYFEKLIKDLVDETEKSLEEDLDGVRARYEWNAARKFSRLIDARIEEGNRAEKMLKQVVTNIELLRGERQPEQKDRGRFRT
jgi:3-oxoacyl-ACP reductase-like protein